jgi:hypothetical protein
MKGTFKKPFEKEAAEKLATYLEEGGITFETKWEFKSTSLPEDDPNNSATALILTSNGKTFFSHRGKIGAVTPKHIPEDKHSVLYEGLAKAGFYTEPNFGFGMILVILHLIVYFSWFCPNTWISAATLRPLVWCLPSPCILACFSSTLVPSKSNPHWLYLGYAPTFQEPCRVSRRRC